jgi:hypothetical protein
MNLHVKTEIFLMNSQIIDENPVFRESTEDLIEKRRVTSRSLRKSSTNSAKHLISQTTPVHLRLGKISRRSLTQTLAPHLKDPLPTKRELEHEFIGEATVRAG